MALKWKEKLDKFCYQISKIKNIQTEMKKFKLVTVF